MAMMLSFKGNDSSVSVVPCFQVTGLISPLTTSTSTGWVMPLFFKDKFTNSGVNELPGRLCAASQYATTALPFAERNP